MSVVRLIARAQTVKGQLLECARRRSCLNRTSVGFGGIREIPEAANSEGI
jgi:hypothetical protein